MLQLLFYMSVSVLFFCGTFIVFHKSLDKIHYILTTIKEDVQNLTVSLARK